jgi:hypothetical protein
MRTFNSLFFKVYLNSSQILIVYTIYLFQVHRAQFKSTLLLFHAFMEACERFDNPKGRVVINMIASRAVDSGFKPWSSQNEIL